MNYSDSHFVGLNPNGYSFMGNFCSFFIVQLPTMVFVEALLYFTFILVKKYKVSRLFRLYSFGYIILFMAFEGSVEVYSFYFFAETRNMHSHSFLHKNSNIFMLLFFFLMLFYAIALLMWLRYHYSRNVNYFLD